MPLDNENVQVLQQKREQRRQEIQNQTYLGRQQQQWQQERDVQFLPQEPQSKRQQNISLEATKKKGS